MMMLNTVFTRKDENISLSVFLNLLLYSSIENIPSSQSLYGKEILTFWIT